MPVRDKLYLRELVELSRVIGASQGIRQACYGRNDQYWRGFMQQLVDLEAPNKGELYSDMVSAYRSGVRRELRNRRDCEGAAKQRELQYAREGRQISERMQRYYGTN